jgi:hypothetical protein
MHEPDEHIISQSTEDFKMFQGEGNAKNSSSGDVQVIKGQMFREYALVTAGN